MSQKKKAAKKAAPKKQPAKAIAPLTINEAKLKEHQLASLKPMKTAKKGKAKSALDKSIEAVDALIYPKKHSAAAKKTTKKAVKKAAKKSRYKVVGTITSEHKIWTKSETGEKPAEYGRPYVVIVSNTSDKPNTFCLGGAGLNRQLDNFGNPSGITITYGLIGYTYQQFLADTEAKPVVIGKLRMELKQGDAANLMSPLSVVKTSSEGTIHGSPLTPFTPLSKDDEILDAEIITDFEFDGNTSLEGKLSADAIMYFYFYPATKVASAAAASEAKPEFEIKPQPHVKPTRTIESSLQDEFEAMKKKAMGIDGKDKEESRAYILEIKNNSQTKIEGFRLNNIKQALQQGKEYDDRVTVSYGLTGYTYQAFLSHFVTHPTKFGRIRYEAFHGYENYKRQQLNACPLYIIESEPNGDSNTKAEILSTALNQFTQDAVEKACNFDLVGLGWDIRLDLMPDVRVRIHLFPALVMDYWKQEKESLSPPQIGGVAPVKIIEDDRVAALQKEVSRLETALAEKTKENQPPVAEAFADAAFPKDKK